VGRDYAANGAVEQSNFDTFPVARMNNAPRETHVHIVESDAAPGGIGEPGCRRLRGAVQRDFCGDWEAHSRIAVEQGGVGLTQKDFVNGYIMKAHDQSLRSKKRT